MPALACQQLAYAIPSLICLAAVTLNGAKQEHLDDVFINWNNLL